MQVQNGYAGNRFSDPAKLIQIRLDQLPVNGHDGAVLIVADGNADHVGVFFANGMPSGRVEDWDMPKALIVERKQREIVR